jgi:GT2 family glycosyltransferase
VNAIVLIIVTYNSAEVLPGLLRSLLDACAGAQWRTIVVDNASTDETVATVQRLLPTADIISLPDNNGYAAGINAAYDRADASEDVLILNPDVLLTPGSVARLAEFAATDDNIGIVVPTVLRADGTREQTLRKRPNALRITAEALLGSRGARWGEQVDEHDISADWANGAVLYVPAQVRSVIGPWTDDLFLYSEEVDYCRRVVDVGFTIRRHPTVTATHIGGESNVSPALWAQLVTNKVVHLARWEDKTQARLAWDALVLGQMMRLPLGKPTHRAALKALLRGRSDLLAGIPTHPAKDKHGK